MTETKQDLIMRAISGQITIGIVATNGTSSKLVWNNDTLVFTTSFNTSIHPSDLLPYANIQEYIEPPKRVKQLTKFYCYKHQNQIKWFSFQWKETSDYFKVVDSKGEHITISYFVERLENEG